MPRFFTGSICGNKALVTGEDARHMALSLRMRPGDAVILCDEQGLDYHCAIVSITPEQVELSIRQVHPSEGEPSVEIVLFQALPKGDKLEWIVQKTAELGVSEVVPVLTDRCISRPDKKSMEKKELRLQKIAAAAAKQAGRGRIPLLSPVVSFSEALTRLSAFPTPLFFYENGTIPLREALSCPCQSPVGLFVGSEGGFSLKEAQQALELGLPGISLGSRILRCETAPITAISAILFATGNL